MARRCAAGAGVAAAAVLLGLATAGRAALVVPVLESRPGAAAKLFLDFDGVNYVGTWGGKTPGNVPAYGTDADDLNFSAAEIGNIRNMWARVAEKYAPFNVNVTTADPGTYLNKQTARVVVGGNNAWYGGGGGVAFVGGFYNSSANTGWAFPRNFGNGTSVKSIAEVVAHEAGHMFGLNHQSRYDTAGAQTQEYNTGTAAKAPVMGNSYSSARGLWWNGTTSSATTFQDDLSILANASNGFGYRNDDHGNAPSLATAMSPTGITSLSAAGVIERTSDVDLFSFDTGPGVVSFNLAVPSLGAMLDGVLKLFDGVGNTLRVVDSTSLGESFSMAVAAGHYNLGVYSKGGYGDIGSYTLSGSVQPLPVPEPAAAGLIALLAGTALLRRGRRAGSGRFGPVDLAPPAARIPGGLFPARSL